MTTETEPMVRIVAVICPQCEFEYTPANYPRLNQPQTVSFVRAYYSKLDLWCEHCGATNVRSPRVATEPVR